MNLLAKKWNGRCISQKYINTKTKLEWECEEGHCFKSTPGNIYMGKWCPICAKKRTAEKLRGSIEEMRKVAAKRGGKCLSSAYTNARTKLTWQCKYGHRWESTPDNIKKRWCPICRQTRISA